MMGLAFIQRRARAVFAEFADRESRAALIAYDPHPVALMPALPPRPALHSPIADSLSGRGYIVCEGVVTGLQMPQGQASATVNIEVPAITAPTQTAGGNAVVLTVDIEAARYLPPNTRVEVALRVIPPDA